MLIISATISEISDNEKPALKKPAKAAKPSFLSDSDDDGEFWMLPCRPGCKTDTLDYIKKPPAKQSTLDFKPAATKAAAKPKAAVRKTPVVSDAESDAPAPKSKAPPAKPKAAPKKAPAKKKMESESEEEASEASEASEDREDAFELDDESDAPPPKAKATAARKAAPVKAKPAPKAAAKKKVQASDSEDEDPLDKDDDSDIEAFSPAPKRKAAAPAAKKAPAPAKKSKKDESDSGSDFDDSYVSLLGSYNMVWQMYKTANRADSSPIRQSRLRDLAGERPKRRPRILICRMTVMSEPGGAIPSGSFLIKAFHRCCTKRPDARPRCTGSGCCRSDCDYAYDAHVCLSRFMSR